MSHIDLLIANIPYEAREHLVLIDERLGVVEALHKKRIRRVLWEKKLIANEVWPENLGNQRKLTPPTAHNIVSTHRALLLPKAPDITIMPLSQDAEAGKEADAVERWLYALLTQKKAWGQFRKQGGEMLAAGMGPMHIQPDRLALKGREVPILLDVPSSESVLWMDGPRGTPAYVFIKHSFTSRELRERFGSVPRYANTRSETEVHEVWCYYAEERYVDSATGDVHQMILYGLFLGNEWIVPLRDITLLFPEIPVVLAFNADGWDWKDRPDLHALGVLSPVNDLLIYAIDYMTQLANSQMRTINPPLVVESQTGAQPPILDLSPLRQNNLVNGEKVRALFDVQPSPQSFAFHETVMQAIADGTLQQIVQPMKDLEGVSGSAMSESMNAAQVRMRVQQDQFAEDIARECLLMLQHVATRIDPQQGLRLLGADPRDRSQINVLMLPDQLLKHVYIDVKLPAQTPRNVTIMAQLINQLARDGIIPTQLAAETVTKWLDLPVSDMSSLMEGVQADMLRKAQLQNAQQVAAQLVPQLRQEANNRGLNPEMLADGRTPSRLGPEAVDPMLTSEAATPTPPRLMLPGGSY